MSERNQPRNLGLWLIGARGAVATCVVYGLSGLRQGLLEPIGLILERPPFDRLPVASFDRIVLGGHEIARRDLTRTVGELAESGVLGHDLVVAAADDAAAFDARIRPGVLDVPDVGRADLDPAVSSLGGAAPREQVERLRADLEAFRDANDLERVVVVNLTTAEVWYEESEAWRDLESFERALDAGEELPASCLYAYAALRSGAPHVNFTPNRGASIPALRELALEVGVPHCGNDGKTGETLLKTALAPMFAARALRVLSWQGYNILGNQDGESLADPARQESKRRNKDAALRSILGGDEVHTGVGIDYVPSLGDWKTAWDHVHFEGFLDTKMSLQFTWRGSDSALAAPLVIDLVRLSDLAARLGEKGEMAHTACFFKSPLAGGTHDFHLQFQRLLEYAEERLG